MGVLTDGKSFFTYLYSLNFNGSDNYVDPGMSAVSPTQISLACWFKTTSASLGRLIVKPNVAASTMSWGLDYEASGAVSFRLATVGGSNITLTSPLTTYGDGNWHHVVGTYDGVNGLLYVDGSLVAGPNAGNAILYAALNVQIGRFDAGAGQYFSGNIDDMRVYSAVITAGDVKNLFNGVDFRGNILAYWPFNDGSGTNALDKSGNGYNGTLSGTKATGMWSTDTPSVLKF